MAKKTELDELRDALMAERIELIKHLESGELISMQIVRMGNRVNKIDKALADLKTVRA